MAPPKKRRRKQRQKRGQTAVDDEFDSDESVNEELKALGFAVEKRPHEKRCGYDLQSKLVCEEFAATYKDLIDALDPEDFNARYFHKNGFKKPIYFRNCAGLGIKMPSAATFTVKDVRRQIGANRVIDVVDVKTQKGCQMTLREFVAYYLHSDRDRLLNVLSLEFSKTKLAKLVAAPSVIRELDWVELAWPKELRDAQTDGTNALNSMKYPKVQNYCLMSVGGCYTDFHVDFGGTSVWYHVLRGEKVFWLAPPTDVNIQHFHAWTLSGRQHETFFGDLVERCVRIRLKAGDTFMIPSGWFHAVYTPVDSLVFGGNFLHSFAIPMQLSVYEIERNTRVPAKFRYPFFLEMQWYVLDRYYFVLTGRTFRREENSNDEEDQISDLSHDFVRNENAVLLTDCELDGLHTLANWLQSLPGSKRRVPDCIRQPETLLRRFHGLLSQLTMIRRSPSPFIYTVLSKPKIQALPTEETTDEKPVAIQKKPHILCRAQKPQNEKIEEKQTTSAKVIPEKPCLHSSRTAEEIDSIITNVISSTCAKNERLSPPSQMVKPSHFSPQLSCIFNDHDYCRNGSANGPFCAATTSEGRPVSKTDHVEKEANPTSPLDHLKKSGGLGTYQSFTDVVLRNNEHSTTSISVLPADYICTTSSSSLPSINTVFADKGEVDGSAINDF